MIEREVGKVKTLSDRIPDQKPPEMPQIPAEEIAAAIQVVACKDGKVYISAPADPMQAFMLLIDGLVETRNRQAKLMEQQIAEREKLVMPFPAGVVPR